MAQRIVVVFGLGLVAAALACSSDLDCSLNGDCVGGTCVCNPGWTDPSCGELSLAAVDPAHGRNGLAHNSSSWGGSVIRDGAGLYHMFFARFELGCGLSEWVNNSVCVHATSSDPLGPFVDSDVALPVFCHGPKIARAIDGTFLLFHIGESNDGAERFCNCASDGGSEKNCISPAPVSSSEPSDGRGYITFATSSSLYGPWTAWGAPILTAAGGWEGWLSNPAVWVQQNGRILLAYRAWGPGNGLLGGLTERMGIAEADTWNATYRRVTTAPIALGEDPFVWLDANGNGHLLTHAGCGHGHSFAPSTNLSDWTAGVHAVSCNITWANGTAVTVSRRERPHLLFSEDGTLTPLVLYSGVEPLARSITDGSFTMANAVLH